MPQSLEKILPSFLSFLVWAWPSQGLIFCEPDIQTRAFEVEPRLVPPLRARLHLHFQMRTRGLKFKISFFFPICLAFDIWTAPRGLLWQSFTDRQIALWAATTWSAAAWVWLDSSKVDLAFIVRTVDVGKNPDLFIAFYPSMLLTVDDNYNLQWLKWMTITRYCWPSKKTTLRHC